MCNSKAQFMATQKSARLSKQTGYATSALQSDEQATNMLLTRQTNVFNVASSSLHLACLPSFA